MICFPNCKINIGLDIVAKREDGFHDLTTVFYPIYGLHDSLEILESKRTSLTIHGIDLTISMEQNIVYKAYTLLQKNFNLPPIDIHLLKYIPHGAGLGGGSADAAFMLKLLNDYFALQLTTHQLIDYASSLGSDCAFFIQNIPSYATGRGEVLSAIPIHLNGYSICIIKPDTYISTAMAFSTVVPQVKALSLLERIQLPIVTWKDTIVNDFENNVFTQFPHLKAIKTELYNSGAIYASMSGSGSSIYGLFEHNSFNESDIKRKFNNARCYSL